MKAAAIVPLNRERLAAVAPDYEAMRQAIEKCGRVDEIRDLADKAVAVQAYYRQSQDVENEMQASRIRLRAERRLGELLEAMKKRGERAGRGETKQQNRMGRGVPFAPTLADLGVPSDRAKRAQQLAHVPEEEFEAALGQNQVAHPRRIISRKERETAGRSLDLWGRLRALGAAIESEEVPDASSWSENLQPFQKEQLRRYVPLILKYLKELIKEIEN